MNADRDDSTEGCETDDECLGVNGDRCLNMVGVDSRLEGLGGRPCLTSGGSTGHARWDALGFD
jgi:hypothetical protein